jgi:hypothetical protein
MSASVTSSCLQRGDEGVKKNFCFRCRDDRLSSAGSIICIEARVRLCSYTVQVVIVSRHTGLCSCPSAHALLLL